MYEQYSTFSPALGRERELLAHLTTWANDLRAQGIPVTLKHQLFNPLGPRFVSVIPHRDLTEYENRRNQWMEDDSFQANLSKALSLSRIAPTTELFEVLVSAPE